MSRILKQLCWWVFLYLLLQIAIEVNEKSPFPHGIGQLLPHILELATITIAGLFLLLAFEETVEKTIAPAIREGLTVLASEVAVNLKTQLEVPPAVIKDFRASIEELIDRHVTTPGVRVLVDEGKISEAAEKAKTIDEEIAVLLRSDKPDDWKKGRELLATLPEPNLTYFVTLAYRFWEKQDFLTARSIAETGLTIAEARNDIGNIAKLKNSLACIYAELKDPSLESIARQYASMALAESPESPFRLDTTSLVQITYARSALEVDEGVRFAELARAKGLPLEDYARNVGLATQRLRELTK